MAASATPAFSAEVTHQRIVLPERLRLVNDLVSGRSVVIDSGLGGAAILHATR